MATKFFIGGNEFYEDEKIAQAALEQFLEEYQIPEDTFVIVKLDQFDS
jgi:hypothetical protein